MSCNTCHEQHHGFAHSNATRPGVHGEPGRRNVMGLANVGYFKSLTWGDPTHLALESQMLTPLQGKTPVEMGMTAEDKVLVDRLGSDACYRRMFTEAFPAERGEISYATVAKALAAFQRTMISASSPYDRYRRGDRAALSPSAKRGEALFTSKRLDCASCHAGADFTDTNGATDPKASFHAIGLPLGEDKGLSEITGDAKDAGKFRTPSLRNIALTAPYMHDGSVRTLPEAIRRHEGVNLDEAEMADMLAFMDALTDRAFVENQRFALPKTHCGVKQ